MIDDGTVLEALRRDLAGMPDELRTGTVAMAAEALARSIDMGPKSFRFHSALVAQLIDCLETLRAAAPEEKKDTVDDLNARRAARRRAAATG